DLPPGLAEQRVGEQAAAHADLAVDPPDRELDPRLVQGLPPSQHVLVDAVDERPVEVEHERWTVAHPSTSPGSPTRILPGRTTSAYTPNGSSPPARTPRYRLITDSVGKSRIPVVGSSVVTAHRGTGVPISITAWPTRTRRPAHRSSSWAPAPSISISIRNRPGSTRSERPP